MLRTVLDTNVLVSALLNPAGTPGTLVEGLWKARWEPAASDDILIEYQAVLLRPRFGLARGAVRETMARLRQAALMAAPAEAVQACADPDDDKFLACCLAVAATHLVTGNKRHFPRGSFMGTSIVSPAEFLRIAG
jgi:putative PIN family toxin of toxin-antitoxin system